MAADKNSCPPEAFQKKVCLAHWYNLHEFNVEFFPTILTNAVTFADFKEDNVIAA